MLQITTGKFFPNPAGRTNQLRGILYTNLRLGRDEIIHTSVGDLIPSSSMISGPHALIFEFTEKIESGEIAPGVICSHGVEPYLDDMAAIFCFAFNCVCTPNIDLARRLMSGRRSISIDTPANKLVRRFFDQEIWCKQDEIKFFVCFLEQLLGLPRKAYKAVMRSIKTYVTGLHRITDDLELAYMLMVASVESLAQEFDSYQSDWDSLDERKRLIIDKALDGASEEHIQKVRDAILSIEHVALGKRFRAFVCEHIKPSYFYSGFENEDGPIGRSEIPDALNLAYQIRSKYIHQLKELPNLLSMASYQETFIDLNGGGKFLTLQGLSRLMRQVLIEFIDRQLVIEKEDYPYHNELSGVIQIPVDPQYWVGNVIGDISQQGFKRLEGLVSQLNNILLKGPGQGITDMKNVLSWLEEKVAGLKRSLRLPYLALYVLFNSTVKAEDRYLSQKIDKILDEELTKPSIESLIVVTYLEIAVEWDVEEQEDLLKQYRKKRNHKNGLRLPRIFEAAITLDIA